ncbi:MAG TPA: FIST N-terminal domain-containing protein [Verrucomicrobiota bacterium]|nr:FIST C-terminal domain-containing protein [Verrucomicrobiota bacterium]HPY30080.1 FIST N-terminal domain-containing protein [Verrucomicrobiota bacterium]HQB16551.1 FIST N-terminal domain-containing protein [Verrucomicrobiota bacterium]
MKTGYSMAAHWTGGFDESGLARWAEDLRGQLNGPVSLGLVFTTPQFFPHAETLLEILRVHGRIPVLTGCSSQSLIVGGQEVEEAAGLTLGLYSLPGAEFEACHFTQRQVEEANGPGYWHLETNVDAEQTRGWLTFLDPFHMDLEGWLRSWNEAYAPAPVVGGLASGELQAQQTQVYLNGEVFEEGGVAVSVSGAVKLVGVISQGCTPIGDTWTLTRVERNLIQQIANRPAYQVLADTVENLSPEERRRARGNLFIGLAINEYREEFRRGDFLVRNLLDVDPQSGVLAVGALPRPGQTIQFQRRDASAAQEDMETLFRRVREELAGATIYGGCLCTCNGRGKQLFDQPHHDAQMVQQYFGPLGLTGFFGHGEIGPVGGSSFLHGYTASLALFVQA